MEKREIKLKAQGMIEFVILIGAVLFFFVSFFLIIQENVSDKNLERKTLLAQNIALTVQNEINLASESTNGYSREFKIENMILGEDYNIQIADGRVYVNTTRIGLSYQVLDFVGSIQKGNNIIKKENDTVYLN